MISRGLESPAMVVVTILSTSARLAFVQVPGISVESRSVRPDVPYGDDIHVAGYFTKPPTAAYPLAGT